MTWVRLDDQAVGHPKLREAGYKGWALFTAGLCHASAYLTDGFISEKVVPSLLPDLPQAAQVAQELVKAGVWEKVEGGYMVHDYHDYQPTAEEVRKGRDRKREVDRERQRRHRERSRDGHARTGMTQRDGHAQDSVTDRDHHVAESVTERDGHGVTSVTKSLPKRDNRVTAGVTERDVTLPPDPDPEDTKPKKTDGPDNNVRARLVVSSPSVRSIFKILSKIPGRTSFPEPSTVAAWFDCSGVDLAYAAKTAAALDAKWDGRNDDVWATFKTWVKLPEKPTFTPEEGVNGDAGRHPPDDQDPYRADEERIRKRLDARARGEVL